MSNQQPNAWQTAGRPRPSQSASRTPQDRSGTASPNQQQTPPRQEGGGRPQQQQQVNKVWTQRSSSAGGSNGPARADLAGQDEEHKSVNGFNAAEVKAFLSRDAAPTAYKPAEGAGAGAGRGSGGAWESKANHMANNQPFFVQLAKQVATLEGGG